MSMSHEGAGGWQSNSCLRFTAWAKPTYINAWEQGGPFLNQEAPGWGAHSEQPFALVRGVSSHAPNWPSGADLDARTR